MTPHPTINLKDLPILLPHNIPWSRLFNNHHPIDLEIGCGRPHFFFDRALNFKERNIVGVEWKFEFIDRAQRRIIRENITNAAIFHGNAWLLVPLFFARKTISVVFINFPDPWWKKRHKKRLVLNNTFLSILRERMKNDGHMVVQTDVSELFTAYQELIEKHGAFHFDSTIEGISPFLNAKSHREKKCLEQGLPIFRGIFRPL
jgi:tRNA (guanine-N7-)-methyltransferase